MTRFKYQKKQVKFTAYLDYMPVQQGILGISDTRTNHFTTSFLSLTNFYNFLMQRNIKLKAAKRKLQNMKNATKSPSILSA
jgi:site-specific recombinase XerD